MANVCNEDAIINCPHAGVAVLTGKGIALLKANSKNVLTYLSIIGATISGCGYSTPCTVIVSCTAQSIKVTIGGNGVVLDSSLITITNPSLGPVPGTIVSAGQIKLTSTS